MPAQARGALPVHILRKKGKQSVIAPGPVNAQIIARKALFAEAKLCEQAP
jgi:hypothetical protein